MVIESIYKNTWYSHGAGVRLAEAEKQELDDILPALHGYHLVQISDQGLIHNMSGSLVSHRVLVHPDVSLCAPTNKVKANFDCLPFKSESVDVVVLAHILEQVSNPHDILKEVYRVLIPEGHVVITGINPLSCWGAWYHYKKISQKFTSSGHLLGLLRIRDWLKLLDFQVTGGKYFYFKPPILNNKILKKLDFLEKIGSSIWPFFGGGYSIVAVKKIIPLTPIKAKWKTKSQGWLESGTIPKPTANRRQ